MIGDLCKWPGCNQPVNIGYRGSKLCAEHWERICELDDDNAGLAMALMELGKQAERKENHGIAVARD